MRCFLSPCCLIPSRVLHSSSSHVPGPSTASSRRDNTDMLRVRGSVSAPVQNDLNETMINPTLSSTLSPDLDDQALAYFSSNFVIGDWRPSYRTNLQSHGIDDTF
jgi:hypothetical protein